MTTTITNRLDPLMQRLLFVQPRAENYDTGIEIEGVTQTAERAFSLSLLFSGIRCILQYVILPFILPIVGIAGDFAIGISMVINVMAIGGIIYSLRKFWQVDYKHKWRYLPIAVVALFLLISFLVLDVYTLTTT